ncbi:hypothetical protein B0H14DRAFT_54747 [Mycena olivaceomarginata]|nr:hypothetical protein B0H14DRAFT_54747 [Mycena olivaceomarginata]
MDSFNATGAVTTIQIIRSGVLAVYFLAIYEWLETLPTRNRTDPSFTMEFNKSGIPLCRYYQLLVWPLVIYAYDGNHTAQTCSKLTEIVTCFLLPMQLFAPGVMLMRAYAFAGRNIRVLVLLLVFYAALIGIDVWFFLLQRRAHAGYRIRAPRWRRMLPELCSQQRRRTFSDFHERIFSDGLSLLINYYYLLSADT